jgi:hypothetical protein
VAFTEGEKKKSVLKELVNVVGLDSADGGLLWKLGGQELKEQKSGGLQPWLCSVSFSYLFFLPQSESMH